MSDEPQRPGPTVGEPAPEGAEAPLRRAFLGLGSNLGDRVRFLRDAVETLRAVGLVGVSPVYETAPFGGPDQGPYLNLVVELQTDRSPRELLGVCRRLEAAADRVRDARWGPRPLAVDVLFPASEAGARPAVVLLPGWTESRYAMLDEAKAYCRNIKIVVTGGFNAERIAQFEREGVPVDIYGVGSTLLRNDSSVNTDFTMDVVRVYLQGQWHDVPKVGRMPNDNADLKPVDLGQF